MPNFLIIGIMNKANFSAVLFIQYIVTGNFVMMYCLSSVELSAVSIECPNITIMPELC